MIFVVKKIAIFLVIFYSFTKALIEIYKSRENGLSE